MRLNLFTKTCNCDIIGEIMPKRNTKLTANTVYHVTKPDGKHYRVYSKATLDKRIEEGVITDQDKVVIQRVDNS